MKKEQTVDDHPDSVVDTISSTEKLLAHVVTPQLPWRIHGYDVEHDLARHYSLLETFLLAFTGEIAPENYGRALEIALIFLSPKSVAHDSTHAGILTQVIGASPSPILSTTLMILTEEAQDLIKRHELLLNLLNQEELNYLPEEFQTEDAQERASVERLALALEETGITLPFKEFSRDAALLYTLHRVGLKTPLQLCSVIVLSRLPAIVAEVGYWQKGKLENYPMKLPNFRYED
ncbi:hypothetical protein [Moorena sp. SIO3I6]|uniref:hypothetical protein n=1 Tax=Moorena sp. SIO3I6 TaxID=2607831 RepID=UPI0013F8CD18|nr:hypothetical protein [Moorena sp. SIO3I6]NEP23126.1 hypothetical protein [Moorena sp. SIO3I6]